MCHFTRARAYAHRCTCLHDVAYDVTSRPKLLTQAMAELSQEDNTGWKQTCVLPHTSAAVLLGWKAWASGDSWPSSESHSRRMASALADKSPTKRQIPWPQTRPDAHCLGWQPCGLLSHLATPPSCLRAFSCHKKPCLRLCFQRPDLRRGLQQSAKMDCDRCIERKRRHKEGRPPN